MKSKQVSPLPILIGNMVEAHAPVVYTSNTSMHCIIFVALDEENKPVGVTPWDRQTEEEAAMEHYAVRLIETRRVIEDKLQPHQG